MNLLVVTYWSFNDPLVQTYTLPYIQIIRKYLPPGSHIYLQTLEQPSYVIPRERFEEIKKEYAKQNIHIVSFPYARFGLKAIINAFTFIPKLLLLVHRKKIKGIHGWCTPGGGIGYIVSTFTGKPLVLDSFEPHAEVMVETQVWKRESFAFKLLFWLEKKQVKKARAVITLTHSMKDYTLRKYGVELKKYYVKPALVDFGIFNPEVQFDGELQKKLGLENKIVCVYAGKIGGIYLTKEIFDFFKVASDYWGDRFRVLFMTKHAEEDVLKYAHNASLDTSKVIVRFVPHTEIHRWMRITTFAINPVKPVPSRRHCTSIKDGEYWGMGLPVVITPDISEDSSIIEQNKIGAILKGFTKKDYLDTVKQMDSVINGTTRAELAARIFGIAQKYRSFTIADDVYKSIYGGTHNG
jgi:hypothetical protein